MMELEECIETNQASIVLATPALWRLIPKQRFGVDPRDRMPSLRKLFLGGDRWSRSELFLPHCLALYNIYGVTECTVYQAVSGNLVQDARKEAERELYPLLGHGALSFEVSPEGELLIGGGLVLSYLTTGQTGKESKPGGAELPDACSKFLIRGEEAEELAGLSLLDGSIDEVGKTPSTYLEMPLGVNRWFCTGDRVELELPLRLKGRLDRQVKLNGFRIELGEIEATLSAAPGCHQAFCHLSKKSKNKKEHRLVCWVARNPMPTPLEKATAPKRGSFDFLPSCLREKGETEAANLNLCSLLSWDILRHRKRDGNRKWEEPEALSWGDFAIAVRAYCEAYLPRYEIPAKFLPLLVDPPLLPNGKVDRGQLETWADNEELPGVADGSTAASDMGQLTEMEAALAKVWSKVLSLDEQGGAATLSPHSHFFELGGNSDLAVQMVMRLKGDPVFSGPRLTWGWGTSSEIPASELQHRRLCGLINQPRLRGFAGFLEREVVVTGGGECISAKEDVPTPSKKKKIRRKRMNLRCGLQRKTMEMLTRHVSSPEQAPEERDEASVTPEPTPAPAEEGVAEESCTPCGAADRNLDIDVHVFLASLRFQDLDVAETFLAAGIMGRLPNHRGLPEPR